jgi:hypothetical protein
VKGRLIERQIQPSFGESQIELDRAKRVGALSISCKIPKQQQVGTE